MRTLAKVHLGRAELPAKRNYSIWFTLHTNLAFSETKSTHHHFFLIPYYPEWTYYFLPSGCYSIKSAFPEDLLIGLPEGQFAFLWNSMWIGLWEGRFSNRPSGKDDSQRIGLPARPALRLVFLEGRLSFLYDLSYFSAFTSYIHRYTFLAS